jgi:hypothetical protein
MPNPEMTAAEAFAMFRYAWDDLSLTFGPGLFLSKINIPYENEKDAEDEAKAKDPDAEDPKPSARAASAMPALALGVRSEIGGFILDAQLSGSSPTKDSYVTFEMTANYRLTETWFVGGDLMYLRLSEARSQGAPGATLMGVGGHIGFVLRRAKEEVRHK